MQRLAMAAGTCVLPSPEGPGGSSGRSRRRKPAPPHSGHTAPRSSEAASTPLLAAEVSVAAEEPGAGAATLARISSSLFTRPSFRCPTLQDARHVAPGALVEQRRLPQRLLQPLVRVELLRLLQLLGDQRRQRPDVRLVELKDVVAPRRGHPPLRRPAPAPADAPV